MRRRKTKVVFDLDDTLIDTRTPIWRLHCKLSGTSFHSPERETFNYHQIWQANPDYCDRLMSMYMSGKNVRQPRIMPGARRVLRQLCETHLFVVATARNIRWYSQTLSQLQAFGCDFHRVHVCTDKEGETTPKAMVCREYGYDIIIDDHPETTNECAAIGMKSFLFGQYPWTNSHDGLLNLVRAVHNWHQVYRNIVTITRA